MTDYGHPLSFGSFITPENTDPERAVSLAVLAEELGLDLVTFQDHPYLPGFFDTWTLLSFVAARTTRVHLSGNVVNLPLRPPAVLGRSVASLDILSGGRVELGLGAGAFWDGIEAMGSRRLSGGASVRALEEAIDVLRQIWDADAPGGVRLDGEFYRVVGAKRGPAPAHPVGIWLGAYKPRMLELTGRRADGWLPSLSYLQPGDLATGNAIIDEAAAQAGRAPTDVLRLLNISGEFSPTGGAFPQGPLEQWIDELSTFALRDGISTFIFGSDTPNDLRRFAGEVVPAVRELVTAERKAHLGSAPASSDPPAAPEAKRSPPPAAERGALVVTPTPDDGLRRSARQVWDESTRPTGPVPEPGRKYTSEDQASAQELIEVHNVLRAELAQIYDLIDQISAGTTDVGAARSQINTMTIRQNNWTLGTYCESYCRLVTTHHTLEDRAVFPHLRRCDARLAAVLDRLGQEHVTIHDVIEGLDRALVEFVSSPGGIANLRAAVDLLSDTLLSHLAYEERELVEPLARLGMA